MTEENKELLLKYLCMALPYGVICQFIWAYSNETTDGDWVITQHDDNIKCINIHVKEIQADYYDEWVDLEHCKPYLRPMSSMTEEEMDELESITFPLVEKDWDGNENPACVRLIDVPKYMNFILSNHFDFMGLIPKGLAIEAPEGTYSINN